jgi:glycosyltransferase involved in cell wall biosynthesis
MTEKAGINKSVYPTISIIIATLNVENTLQNCLDSIYRQAYPAIEIIIMDGGSTDATVDIIKKNKKKIGFWKSEPDAGVYYAMNKAFDHITGDRVYFLGADDELLDDFSMLAAQLKNGAVIYYANVLLKGKKYRGEVTAYVHAKGTICHQAIIYPRHVFDRYRFNTKYPISADHELNMRCWNDKNLSFHYVDLIIANFSFTGLSSLNVDHVFESDKLTLILKYHGYINWARYSLRLLKEKLFPEKYDRNLPPTL